MVKRKRVILSVLALDLGLNTGYAVGAYSGIVESGTISLKEPKNNIFSWCETSDSSRYGILEEFLTNASNIHELHALVFEEPYYGIVNATRSLYGFKAVVLSFCQRNCIRCIGLTPKEIKKSFCNNGRASKSQIMQECQNRGIDVDTEHEADAVACLYSFYNSRQGDISG